MPGGAYWCIEVKGDALDFWKIGEAGLSANLELPVGLSANLELRQKKLDSEPAKKKEFLCFVPKAS